MEKNFHFTVNSFSYCLQMILDAFNCLDCGQWVDLGSFYSFCPGHDPSKDVKLIGSNFKIFTEICCSGKREILMKVYLKGYGFLEGAENEQSQIELATITAHCGSMDDGKEQVFKLAQKILQYGTEFIDHYAKAFSPEGMDIGIGDNLREKSIIPLPMDNIWTKHIVSKYPELQKMLDDGCVFYSRTSAAILLALHEMKLSPTLTEAQYEHRFLGLRANGTTFVMGSCGIEYLRANLKNPDFVAFAVKKPEAVKAVTPAESLNFDSEKVANWFASANGHHLVMEWREVDELVNRWSKLRFSSPNFSAYALRNKNNDHRIVIVVENLDESGRTEINNMRNHFPETDSFEKRKGCNQYLGIAMSNAVFASIFEKCGITDAHRRLTMSFGTDTHVYFIFTGAAPLMEKENGPVQETASSTPSLSNTPSKEGKQGAELKCSKSLFLDWDRVNNLLKKWAKDQFGNHVSAYASWYNIGNPPCMRVIGLREKDQPIVNMLWEQYCPAIFSDPADPGCITPGVYAFPSAVFCGVFTEILQEVPFNMVEVQKAVASKDGVVFHEKSF